MPSWLYFSKPINQAMHDFTSYDNPPSYLKNLFGLNLKFIPRTKYTPHDLDDSIKHFRQNAYIHDYYLHFPPEMQEDQPLKNKKLHIPTHWMPPHSKISKDIVAGTTKFGSALERIFTKKTMLPEFINHPTTSPTRTQDQEQVCHRQGRQESRTMHHRNGCIYPICDQRPPSLSSNLPTTVSTVGQGTHAGSSKESEEISFEIQG